MGTETIRYTQLGEQDLRFGTGTFEVTLADGRKVVLNEVDIGDILSDATKSTRTVTLDELTVATLNFSGTLSGAALSISGAATFGSLSTASATITSTPTARTHALTVGNVQDGLGVYVASVGGTADAITLSPSPAITAYAAGQTFRFVAGSTNTGAVTVAVSGLSAQAITKNGTDALIASDLPQGAMVEITYDGTRFIIGTVGAATGAAGAVVLTTVTTKGDLIIATADETVTRLAIGANGTIPMARSAATTGLAYVAALTKAIHGLTYSNGTDVTNDIDFAAGGCMDSTNAVWITCAAMAGKQLDVGWAPGAAAGMRDSGAAIANGTYHLYAVAKADGTQDYYAHTSTVVATVITALQAETDGTNYLYARRIGSILRESAAIVAFVQNGDDFDRKASVLSVTAVNPGASAVLRTMSVPTGLKLIVKFNGGTKNTGTAALAASHFSDPAVDDEAVSDTAAPLACTPTVAAAAGNVDWAYATHFVRCNTSAQVRSRLLGSDGSVTLYMATRGWTDDRGRMA